jgi:hypothetical protein
MLEFKDESEMRESLARLGLSSEKIERAVATWRNRPHPSLSNKPPHPMKGKSFPLPPAKNTLQVQSHWTLGTEVAPFLGT